MYSPVGLTSQPCGDFGVGRKYTRPGHRITSYNVCYTKLLRYFLNRGTESYSEALSYFPELENYNIGPDRYLELIKKYKENLSIPVIGSLNGISSGGWIEYAKKIEDSYNFV